MRPVFATLLLSALALGACEKSVTGPEPVRAFTTAEEEIAESNTVFGLGLLRYLHASDAAPNLLVSPLSASMALGMTMNGAQAGTWTAMRTALGFDRLTEEEINSAYRGLIAQLRARDPKVEFTLANSIWYRQEFQVKQPFLLAGRDHFDAHIAAIDFNSAAAPRTISQWAENRTGGRIKDLVESIDPLDMMFLVNAVYFKAPWTHPFQVPATMPRPFVRANGSSVDVPTMLLDRALPHLMNDEVQIVELPYADGAFSMVLLAPPRGTSLDGLVARLTPQLWTQWLDALAAERIMLMMPKFRFDYGVELKPSLSDLGMGVAFRSREADFTRIADRDDLHISAVQHKTFIDVHELGTEAAAATSVTASVTSMPPELNFDRPFIFAIRERSTGTLLFIGRIGDPSAS
ncbi:serpin family protein [soil metagenome]